MSAMTDHARQRAQERYGLDLTDADAREIVQACRGGTAVRLAGDDDAATFIVRFRDIPIIAALNIHRWFIITFFPADYFAKTRRGRHLRNKQSPATAKSVDGRIYNRAKAKSVVVDGGEF